MGSRENLGNCKALAALEVVKLANEDAYDVLISTDQLNRNGWEINYKGWELENYIRNPVVMWGHDYYTVPVGRSQEIAIDKKAKGLASKFEFRPAANDYDPIHPIKVAWDAGFLRAASVGFLPLEYEPLDENASEYFGPFRSLRQDLLEWSIVPIPADPSTLRKNLVGFSRGEVNLDRAVMAFTPELRLFSLAGIDFPARLDPAIRSDELHVGGAVITNIAITTNATTQEDPDLDPEDGPAPEDDLAPAANVDKRDSDGPEDEADLPAPITDALDRLLGVIRDNIS